MTIKELRKLTKEVQKEIDFDAERDASKLYDYLITDYLPKRAAIGENVALIEFNLHFKAHKKTMPLFRTSDGYKALVLLKTIRKLEQDGYRCENKFLGLYAISW